MTRPPSTPPAQHSLGRRCEQLVHATVAARPNLASTCCRRSGTLATPAPSASGPDRAADESGVSR